MKRVGLRLKPNTVRRMWTIKYQGEHESMSSNPRPAISEVNSGIGSANNSGAAAIKWLMLRWIENNLDPFPTNT